MALIHLTLNTRFVYEEAIYRIDDILPAKNKQEGIRYQLENMSAGRFVIWTRSQIEERYNAKENKLVFEVSGRNTVTDPHRPLRIAHKYEDLVSVPDKLTDITWKRYQILQELYDYCGIPVTKPTKFPRKTIQQFAEEKGYTGSTKGEKSSLADACSASSIERWANFLYEANGDILALVPQTDESGGKGGTRTNDDVEQIIQTVIEEFKNKDFIMKVSVFLLESNIRVRLTDMNRFRKNKLNMPSPSTVRRRAKAAGILRSRPRYKEDGGGSDASQPGVKVERIGQRYEFDQCKSHMFIVDDNHRLPIGRLTVTGIIDCRSGMVPGEHFSIGEGYAVSVMQALYKAFAHNPDYVELFGTQKNLDIVRGVCELLAIDNGKQFAGTNLYNACRGITRLDRMPRKTPWYKPKIERWNRTTNQQLLSAGHGYTFSNYLETGDYNPRKNACISLSAFLEMYYNWKVDMYSSKYHEGVRGVPLQIWDNDWGTGYELPMWHSLDNLEKRLAPYEIRALNHYGIEWKTLTYNAPELGYLRDYYTENPDLKAEEEARKVSKESYSSESPRKRSPRVRFRYYSDTMEYIDLEHPEKPGRWIRLYADDSYGYTKGLTLYQHDFIRKQERLIEKDEEYLLGLANAKVRLQNIMEDEFVHTKSARKAKTAARFLGLDKPDAHTPSTQSQSNVSKDDADDEFTPDFSEPDPMLEDDLDMDDDGWSSGYSDDEDDTDE